MEDLHLQDLARDHSDREQREEDERDCSRELQAPRVEEDRNYREPEGDLKVGDTLGSQAEIQADSCKELEDPQEDPLVVLDGKKEDRVSQALAPGLRTLHCSCFKCQPEKVSDRISLKIITFSIIIK